MYNKHIAKYKNIISKYSPSIEEYPKNMCIITAKMIELLENVINEHDDLQAKQNTLNNLRTISLDLINSISIEGNDISEEAKKERALFLGFYVGVYENIMELQLKWDEHIYNTVLNDLRCYHELWKTSKVSQ